MTRHELKNKLQDICEKNVEIIDVFFYKRGDQQMIVVPHFRSYKAISGRLEAYTSDTIENW